MRKYTGWISVLLVILVFLIFTPSVLGLDRFPIHVYDANGNPAPGAAVIVWEGGTQKYSDFTNGEGIYDAWLDMNMRYRIEARRNNQFGQWEGIPGSINYVINIYMRFV